MLASGCVGEMIFMTSRKSYYSQRYFELPYVTLMAVLKRRKNSSKQSLWTKEQLFVFLAEVSYRNFSCTS